MYKLLSCMYIIVLLIGCNAKSMFVGKFVLNTAPRTYRETLKIKTFVPLAINAIKGAKMHESAKNSQSCYQKFFDKADEYTIETPIIKQIRKHEGDLRNEKRKVFYYQVPKNVDFVVQVYAKLQGIIEKKETNKDQCFSLKKIKNVKEYFLRLISASKNWEGSLGKPGDCTICYTTGNSCIDIDCNPPARIENIFDSFEIDSCIFARYKDRIENLWQLNNKIDQCRILQVGLQQKSWLQICLTKEEFSKTRNVSEIKIESLTKSKIDKNGILSLEALQKERKFICEVHVEPMLDFATNEKKMIMSTNYDPLPSDDKLIIKMHSYLVGDEEQLLIYNRQKDELFEEIARDFTSLK